MVDFLKELEIRLLVFGELGCKKAHNLKDLLSKEQPYVNYENKLLAMRFNEDWETSYPVNHQRKMTKGIKKKRNTYPAPNLMFILPLTLHVKEFGKNV